jgi:CO/xanthine dehydrogenase Mo-binding subunit
MTSRREFLRDSGALVVAFSLAPSRAQAQAQRVGGKKLPGSLARDPWLDAWIRVDANGAITVFTGKAELGQGIRTALLQVAAEELDVALEAVALVTADTARTPNEGFTAGSHSLQDSGTAIRNAAAQVRALLVNEAARRWQAAPAALRVEQGTVHASDGRSASYGELAAALDLHVEAQPDAPLKDPAAFRVMDRPVPRVDIPAKVSGGVAYVHDLRLPGMLHARVVRPPSPGAQLLSIDRAAGHRAGVVKVIRDGNFLAVVADREWTAIRAMEDLARGARWREGRSLPATQAPRTILAGLAAKDSVILERGTRGARGVRTIEAEYLRPWLMHGSIGPSCAVAHLEGDRLTVWSHTQGVFPDRKAIAQMLGMAPEKLRIVHREGAGCYGHNGADDAAADAALVATHVAGRPVRLQWMREQEHAWEPYGAAMRVQVRASLDGAGRIVDWDYGVSSNTHSTRPGSAGSLLAGREIATPFEAPRPHPIPLPDGGGDRNAIPPYALPNARITHHFIEEMPLRVSALRSLGAHMNVFAIVSFMDEIALAAGIDPVELRLAHLEDPRAREVVRRAARRFGWRRGAPAAMGTGQGFAFARYKNSAAYCAVACEVEVDLDTGRPHIGRVVAAVDGGQVVNPDGLRNQIEGAIVQSASWTLYERVAFDARRIRSVDWQTYPILRFDAVPRAIEVEIVDRPGAPFLGSGEAGQGPAAAAIANAIAHASGVRRREMPLANRSLSLGRGPGRG